MKTIYSILWLCASLALSSPARTGDFSIENTGLKDLKVQASAIAVPGQFGSGRDNPFLLVNLVLKPGTISAGTAFEGVAKVQQRAIITIILKSGTPDAAAEYIELGIENPGDPAKTGSLARYKGESLKWIYIPFEESKSEASPKEANIVITPKYKGHACGAPVTLKVKPVFSYLTGFHTHSFGKPGHMPDERDYDTALKYAQWKYDIDTSNLTEISYSADIKEMAVTNPGQFNVGRYCKVGRGAFMSENICASTLGHENVHGGQSLLVFLGSDRVSEPPAYQWEADNAARLGVTADYLEECRQWIKYYNGQGGKPK